MNSSCKDEFSSEKTVGIKSLQHDKLGKYSFQSKVKFLLKSTISLCMHTEIKERLTTSKPANRGSNLEFDFISDVPRIDCTTFIFKVKLNSGLKVLFRSVGRSAVG